MARVIAHSVVVLEVTQRELAIIQDEIHRSVEAMKSEDLTGQYTLQDYYKELTQLSFDLSVHN